MDTIDIVEVVFGVLFIALGMWRLRASAPLSVHEPPYAYTCVTTTIIGVGIGFLFVAFLL